MGLLYFWKYGMIFSGDLTIEPMEEIPASAVICEVTLETEKEKPHDLVFMKHGEDGT